MRNFTAIDIVGSVEASLLFTLILFIPGFVLGWLSNTFDFRKHPFPTQVLLSSPLGIAILPILVYLLGPYPRALWAIFGATWLVFLLLLPGIVVRLSRTRIQLSRSTALTAAAFALGWAFLAIASLVDLQFKNRLYFSSTAYDYSTRTAFTAAAVRAIPPANPFFATNPPVPLRYHYFWMLLCSLVARLGHVGSRQALFGGTVWAGITLMSLIAISLSFFSGIRERFKQKTLIGCALLLVTGLDILPNLYLYLHFHQVIADMEWWNAVQITSWIDSLLWVPHHVMGLVGCMVGFLALRYEATTRFQRSIAICTAGLAFASSAGLSVLVTFTFAVSAVIWLLFAAHRKAWGEIAGIVTAGAISLFIGLPYISTLIEPALDGSGGGGRFFAFGVREFSFATDFFASRFHFLPQTWTGRELFLLLLLPLNYFFELGFFVLVAAIRIRSIRTGSIKISRQEEMAWILVGTSFLVGSFLRSTTISSNDLGWRCFLPAQLVFLIWGALLLDDWWSARRVVLEPKRLLVAFCGVLLALGLIGTGYQVVMLRAFPILMDEGKLEGTALWLGDTHRFGEQTYALREAYEGLGRLLPAEAVIQYNPFAPAFIAHQFYSGHDAAIGLPLCGANFGGNVNQCIPRMVSAASLFSKLSQDESANLDLTCNTYGIDAVLVDDSDPVWGKRDSWVWGRQPLLSNDHVRAFACGDRAQQTRLFSPGPRGN